MRDLSKFKPRCLPHKQLGIFGIIAGVFAAGSAILGVKASKAKRKSAKAERSAQEVSNFRQVRDVIRASRLARASTISNAQATGGEIGSSGIQGSLQSIRAQTASNLLINNRIGEFQGTAFDQSLRANKFSTFSNILGTAASLSLIAAGSFGGPEKETTTGGGGTG